MVRRNTIRAHRASVREALAEQRAGRLTHLAIAIRCERRRVGLHRREVAARLGVHASLVEQWETGRIWPPYYRREQLAAALGVPVSRFPADPACWGQNYRGPRRIAVASAPVAHGPAPTDEWVEPGEIDEAEVLRRLRALRAVAEQTARIVDHARAESRRSAA